MSETAGIKYTKDASGRKRYVRIDLDMYGDNQLLEDFLDGLEAEAQKDEPFYPLEEVIARENKRRGLNVEHTPLNKCTTSYYHESPKDI